MCCHFTSNGEVLLLDLGDGKTTEVDTDDFNFRSLPLDKGVSLYREGEMVSLSSPLCLNGLVHLIAISLLYRFQGL